MLKQLILDANKCTSCVQCELACSLEHEGLFAPAFSRIKVFEFEHGKRNIPYTCTQCEEAWCMKACPTDAKCVGCKVCTIACPYGTINFNTRSGKVTKCNLCDGDPKCAEACPTGAITYDFPAGANA